MYTLYTIYRRFGGRDGRSIAPITTDSRDKVVEFLNTMHPTIQATQIVKEERTDVTEEFLGRPAECLPKR